MPGTDVLTLVGGNTTIASITTPGGGRTYHGDAQMFIDAGGPDDFDPSLVFAQDAGPERRQLHRDRRDLDRAAPGRGSVDQHRRHHRLQQRVARCGGVGHHRQRSTPACCTSSPGTDITTGDIFAFDGVDMDAGGSILTGNIDAGSIDLLAGGDITTGYLNTQLIPQLRAAASARCCSPAPASRWNPGGDISHRRHQLDRRGLC